jgi:hypothetical protein
MFQELSPAVKKNHCSRTGVSCSLGSRGLILIISGEALVALGQPADGAPCKVFADWDPALPRLRIQLDHDGKFRLCRPALLKKGAPRLLLRLGRQEHLPDVQLRGLDCIWEPVIETGAGETIDIELPREFRSTDAGRKGVTLAKVRAVAGETV